MATLVNTAVATGNDVPNVNLKEQYTSRNGKSSTTSNASRPASSASSMKEQKYKHVFAVHSKTRVSCLSHDAKERPSFVGFRNLMVLVLLFSNMRLMVLNYKKYGIIFLTGSGISSNDLILGTVLYLLVPMHLLVAFVIELAAAQQAKSAIAKVKKANGASAESDRREVESDALNRMWALVALAHGINATLNLVIATTVVYYYIHHPGIGTLCELHAVIVWLKTCSYAFTNRDLRHAMLHPTNLAPLPELYKTCSYPRNISMGNLCYFWWAPTLVYQPVYPRSPKTRWGYVLRHMLEATVLCIAIWIASAQYAAPLLQNSLDKISLLDLMSILERMMKLSTISLFCWLAGFFALFQSFLNGLAEIMRFGDREFYSDWWNSATVRAYWTTWNKPVYHFMRRHIYAPLIGRGVPPALAQFLVFLFSGALHELLVGVPTHNIIGVAFAGMVFQIPLIFLTDPVQKMSSSMAKTVGNAVFWVSFCLVGQPLAALLYFYAWQAKYGGSNKPQFQGWFSQKT